MKIKYQGNDEETAATTAAAFLLGLGAWRREAASLAAHAFYLMRECYEAKVQFAFPRVVARDGAPHVRQAPSALSAPLREIKSGPADAPRESRLLIWNLWSKRNPLGQVVPNMV